MIKRLSILALVLLTVRVGCADIVFTDPVSLLGNAGGINYYEISFGTSAPPVVVVYPSSLSVFGGSVAWWGLPSTNVTGWLQDGSNVGTNDLTNNGADYITETNGATAVMDFVAASSDYANRLTQNFNSSATSGTFYAWIRTTTASTDGFHSSTDTNSGAGDSTLSFRVVGGSGGVPNVFNQTGGVVDSIGWNTDLTVGLWCFVLFESDGSAWDCYIDAVQDGSPTVFAGSNNGNWYGDNSGRDGVWVGVHSAGASLSQYFDGSIGENAVLGLLTQAEKYNLLYHGAVQRSILPTYLVNTNDIDAWDFNSLGTGLVFYAGFDIVDADGTFPALVQDGSGQNNSGTPSVLTGLTETNASGDETGVISLNGSSSRFTIADPMSGTTNFTYAGLIKVDTDDFNASLMTVLDSAGLTPGANGVSIICDDRNGAGTPRDGLHIFFDTTTSFWRFNVDDLFTSTATWYYFALTYDGATPLLYMDGIQQAFSETTSSGSGDSVPGGLHSVGAGSAGNIWFTGRDGSLAYWNRCLSSNEVFTLTAAAREEIL